MYGVEVEFQAAIRHEEAPVSYQMGERSYWIREILKQRLVDEFQREDIPASIEQGEEDEPTTSGRPDRDPKFPGHRRVRTKYLRWQIKNEVKDPPVATYDKDDNPSGYYFLAMELASRAFFAGSREAEQEIREVFALVRAEFDTTLFHCGMHVHLSAQNLTLEQQKRLITLVWIMERRLFALCAPARYRTMELQPISEESTPAVLAASGRLPRLDQSKQWVQEMRRNLPSSMAGSSDEEQLAMFWKVDSMRALKNLLMKPEIGGHGARNALNIKGKCHGDKLGSFEVRMTPPSHRKLTEPGKLTAATLVSISRVNSRSETCQILGGVGCNDGQTGSETGSRVPREADEAIKP